MCAPRDDAALMPAMAPADCSALRGGDDCFRRNFRAEPLAVRDALRAAVARFARRMGPDDAGTLELTLAEVLNNVVEHAYAGLGAGPIDLTLCHAGGRLHCRIEDHGHPMPRLAAMGRAMPATDVACTDLAEGGWGWALVRSLTEGLAYRREGDRNLLTFEFRPACR